MEVKKKSGKWQNIVPTTRKQNLAAAKACDNHYAACSLFRALQYANDMGTHAGDFDELAEHFINKQGLTDYCENGFSDDKIGKLENMARDDMDME
tara:strand:+ start:1154 stop:1438 length:285 start_codon:yes stop_codon:yes gene_type:complete